VYALFGAPAGARAAPFTVVLGYEATAGCPGANEFQELVKARLGYDPFADRSSNHAFVRIVPRGESLTGTIEWRDTTGRWLGDQEVPLAGPDCRRLVRTVALALTVQIRLLASAQSPSAEKTAPPSTGPPVEAALPQSPVPVPAPPPPPPLVPAPVVTAPRTEPRPAVRAPWPRLDIGAGSAIALGMSNGPVFLGRVLGTLGWQSASLELAFEASLPATSRRADGAGFSQQALLAGIAACAPRGNWSACVVAKAGEVRMAGDRIDRPTSAVVPILEGGARLAGVRGLGRHFFLACHADALVNVTRWTGALDQVPVWTAPRFAAVVGIDVGVALPWSGGATSR